MSITLPQRIAELCPPCRDIYHHPELQLREDMAVYLVHLCREKLQEAAGRQVEYQSCTELHEMLLHYWPEALQRNRHIAIANSIQRACNPMYKLDEVFENWLKASQTLSAA